MNLSEIYRNQVKTVRIDVDFSIEYVGHNIEAARDYITRTIKAKKPDAKVWHFDVEEDEITRFLLLNTIIVFSCVLPTREVACLCHELVSSGELDPGNYYILVINPDTEGEKCYALEGNELPDEYNGVF